MTASSVEQIDAVEGFEDEGTLVVDQHFAIVPEWIIDADISDCAYRLYSVLLRYGQSSGQRMPGRAVLAARLKKKSKDTVDRALKELVDLGAVVVERRRRGPVNLTNRYQLVSSPPADEPLLRVGTGPARGVAANLRLPRRMRVPRAMRPLARTRLPLAARMRPNPGVLTQEKPPPPSRSASPSGDDVARTSKGGGGIDVPGLLDACGIDDLEELAAGLQRQRRLLGQPAARWTSARLVEVLHEAVAVRAWPATAAVAALQAIAADRETKGPMRLPCPGPWWDRAERASTQVENDPAVAAELQRLEARLVEADGRRVALQRHARAELDAEGQGLSRLTVARRACDLLDRLEGDS